MPRELPGLYWDEERQRYFPLSSARSPCASASTTSHHRDRTKPQAAPKATRNFHDSKRHKIRTLLRANEDARSSLRTSYKNKLMHQITCSQIARTSCLTSSPVQSLVHTHSAITAFQTVSHNNSVYSFSGDTRGWFYSSIVDLGEPVTGYRTSHDWRPEFSLSSEISSICISGARCIATSFGPESKILHLPLDSDLEDIRVTRVINQSVRDVWTADLLGTRLVLGTNNQAVLINDAAERATVSLLKTGSDVFAVAQDNNMIYAGSRAGVVQRFDARISSTKGDRILNDLDTTRNNSVTNLKIVSDWQLLMSNIDGSLALFDLRFPVNRTPIISFTGNINTYTTKTPIAVDPREDFLFAAGQDRCVRIWSLRSGGSPLVSPVSVFQQSFEDPVRALQVVEEGKGGMILWAASGTALYKYNLGQTMEY
ncbi:hypothetical protein K503DRAFT_734273 [Rhizopogon vinicolor AM-OR11-026]|uniref:WD40 repeat-like protein n=1 Tax=Rhizopogon vinicolor AM-OR11-026 TaxID=1314800 RepID=A0A1B7NBD8_9AGAM|nr:hypothetical protein K503DRAFT_734273 [Rhizopogon vinicolor AM-OR11-026]